MAEPEGQAARGECVLGSMAMPANRIWPGFHSRAAPAEPMKEEAAK